MSTLAPGWFDAFAGQAGFSAVDSDDLIYRTPGQTRQGGGQINIHKLLPKVEIDRPSGALTTAK